MSRGHVAKPGLVGLVGLVRLVGLAGVGACLSLVGCGSDPVMTLSSVSPSRVSARGGESITLHGSGFSTSAEVTLGETRMEGVEIVSPTEVRFTAPPLFAGPLSVGVTVGEESASLPDAIEVLALDLRFVEAPPHAFATSPDEIIVGAALGDFDGDGDADVITCAKMAPCRLVRNDGRGNFAESLEGKSGPRFPDGMPDTQVVAAADFDADGDLDVFLGLGSGGSGILLANDGNAVFEAVFALPEGDLPVLGVAVGDLDGDGLPDLVTSHDPAEMTPIRVHLNASKGAKIAFATDDLAVPEGAYSVSAMALADLDGDGREDLLLGTPGAADGTTIRLLLGGKAGFQEAPSRVPALAEVAASAFATGDVDGDGTIDILAVGAHQDRLFLNDGTGHFFDATLGGMPLDAAQGTSVALVDLDRDRDLDLVIGSAGGETRLYLNDGSGRFFDHTPLLPLRAETTVWVAAANVDGDADMDIMTLHASPEPARLFLSVEPDDAP